MMKRSGVILTLMAALCLFGTAACENEWAESEEPQRTFESEELDAEPIEATTQTTDTATAPEEATVPTPVEDVDSEYEDIDSE